MDNKSIYTMLVAAGMSPAGACGFMGNLQAESAMRSNNVENRCELSDAEYTLMVDGGGYDFATDNKKHYGYGLAQWTYPARKENLLSYARSKGVSVGSATMQIEFAVKELKSEYSGLWGFLCKTNDVYKAASRVCKEYERPAINNIDERAAFADNFYSQFVSLEVSEETEVKEESGGDTMCSVELPIIKKGSKGVCVVAAQTMLNLHKCDCGKVDGDFGSKTDAAVKQFQKKYKLTVDGVIGAKTWAALLKG